MTVSRMIDNFIKFPSDNAEKIHIMQKYYQLSKFPNVLDCIDGTHIFVRSTSKDEHLFKNRKWMFNGCVTPISNSQALSQSGQVD